MGRKTKIPVLLIPGDTIMLEIDNYQELDMRTTYKSVNGNNTLSNLMQTDPKWADREIARDRDANIHPSDLFQDSIPADGHHDHLSTGTAVA